jgi:hypothetical protein
MDGPAEPLTTTRRVDRRRVPEFFARRIVVAAEGVDRPSASGRCVSGDTTISLCRAPEFRERTPPAGNLASWEAICATFGWNAWRRRLLQGLDLARRDLRRAGCRRAWLDGSFVTVKELPDDYDLTWDTSGVDADLLTPVLKAVSPPRWAQKAKYLGDILPNVVERDSGRPFLDFFQEDAETGAAKGIVEMDLEEAE